MRHSIDQLHLSKQKQAQFESKGLTSVEDIAYFFPRRYIDFRKVSRVNDIQVGEFCALEGVVKEKWEGGGSSYTAKIEELKETRPGYKATFYVSWFGTSYHIDKLVTGNSYIFCGKTSVFRGNLYISTPLAFGQDRDKVCSIMPIYSKIQGMSADYMMRQINVSIDFLRLNDKGGPKDLFASGGGAAPHLMMLSKTSEPLSLVSKPLVVRSAHSFLEPLYAQARAFTELRYQELNALISFRIQYYLGQYRIIKAGIDGEEAVEKILELHQGSFLVIHNLRLEFPSSSGSFDSVETDTFVMAPYGLFAIETKNYGASGKYRLVVTGDGNWYKEYPSSSPDRPARRERMENPFEQNDRHIAFLERFINDLLGRDMMNYVHVKNIIVVANDNVEINSDPAAKQTLTRVGNLYNQLTQDPTPRFTLDELHRIEQALTERNLPPKKYPMNDYREELRGIVSAYKRLLNLPAEIYAVENKVYPPNRKPVS